MSVPYPVALRKCFFCYFSCFFVFFVLFFVHHARAAIFRASCTCSHFPSGSSPWERPSGQLQGAFRSLWNCRKWQGKAFGGWLRGMLSSICGKGTAQCLSCAVPSGFLMSFSFVLNLQPGISPAGTGRPGSPGWTVPALPGRPAPGSGCWSRSPSG